MYAVIVSGGRQYRVTEGQTLKVEKLTAEVGSTVDFNYVLMVGSGEDVKLGLPSVSGASVKASIISQGRHKKIKIMKFRRRKHHQKETGHRQSFTEVKIETIQA
jgi:large subunit ribosomal protein L21